MKFDSVSKLQSSVVGIYFVVSVLSVKAKQVWRSPNSWGLRQGSHHSSYSGEMLYSERCCCDGSWWIFSGISVRHWASTLLIKFKGIGGGSRAFLKHAEQSSISILLHQWRYSCWLWHQQERDPKHSSAARTVRAEALCKKKQCIYWNAIHVIFLLKLPYTYKALLLGLHTVVLSWPRWILSCLFSNKAHDHPHCWYLYAKFFCFSRLFMYTQRIVTSRHLTLIHLS